MAKSKRDIDAFQKAMLSNTKIIGKDSKKSSNKKTNTTSKTRQEKTVAKQAGDNAKVNVQIDKSVYERIQKVADQLQIAPEKITEISLELFANLEDYWLLKS